MPGVFMFMALLGPLSVTLIMGRGTVWTAAETTLVRLWLGQLAEFANSLLFFTLYCSLG
jgi:hypothetical protein